MKPFFRITIAFFCLVSEITFAATPENELYTVEKYGKKGMHIILLPHNGCPGKMWDNVIAELSGFAQCHVISFAGFAGQKPISGPDTVYSQKFCKAIAGYIGTRN
jgi:N-formylmaleamate deformylase